MKKTDPHIFTGLQRDMSVSKQDPKFLWDAKNIIFTARNSDTMMSITNEKGTTIKSDIVVKGTLLGSCNINNYVILFTKDASTSEDYIGRNILQNSNFEKDLSKWNHGNITVTSDTYKGNKVIKYTGDNTSIGQYILQVIDKKYLSPNTKYIISCYAKLENTIASNAFGLFVEGNITGSRYSNLDGGTVDWKLYTFEFTTSDILSDVYNVGWYFCTGEPKPGHQTGNVYLTMFQLEASLGNRNLLYNSLYRSVLYAPYNEWLTLPLEIGKEYILSANSYSLGDNPQIYVYSGDYNDNQIIQFNVPFTASKAWTRILIASAYNDQSRLCTISKAKLEQSNIVTAYSKAPEDYSLAPEDTDSNIDYIYRLTFSDTILNEILYQGNLNFDIYHPIETLASYENEFIQKVYWTDNYNQPRVINIVKDKQLSKTVDDIRLTYNDNSFDFVSELQLKEHIYVTKDSNKSGSFPAGVIQYAFTYYNKYGRESNIVYTTPLLHTSFNERAGSPEETINNAFTINIGNADGNFDFMRIYSIFRTSIDATPTVKQITDIDIHNGGDYRYITFIAANGNQYDDADNTSLKEVNPLVITDTIDMNALNDRFRVYKVTESTYLNKFKLSDTEDLSSLPNSNNVYSVIQNGTEWTWIIDTKTNKAYSNIVYNGTWTFTVSQTGYTITSPTKNTDALGINSDGYELSFTDTGEIGTTISPAELLYKGGESITAKTLASKDGTLFIGDYNLQRKKIDNSIKDTIKNSVLTSGLRGIFVPYVNSIFNSSNAYTVLSSGATNHLTTASALKSGEIYRFGIQLQYKDGKWSEPIYIKDQIVDDSVRPSINYAFSTPQGFSSGLQITLPGVTSSIDLTNAYSLGYKKVRALIVIPSILERRIVTQGLLCPTVYSLSSRFSNAPYAQSSWFTRPVIPSTISTADNNINDGATIEFRDRYTLKGYTARGSEIQGIPKELNSVDASGFTSSGTQSIRIKSGVNQTVKNINIEKVFAVDQNIVTMHSPDIEFNDAFSSMDLSGLKLRVVGHADLQRNTGDITLETSSPTISHLGSGFKHRLIASSISGHQLASGLFYGDYLVDDVGSTGIFAAYNKEESEFLFMTYPWHRSGSMNNDVTRPEGSGARSAVLKTKILSNYHVFNWTTWLSSSSYRLFNNISTAGYFNSDKVSLIKIPDANNGSLTYYGNINTLLGSNIEYGSVLSVCNGTNVAVENGVSSFDDTNLCVQMADGLWTADQNTLVTTVIGDNAGALRIYKDPIRMRYKSAPHLVFSLSKTGQTREILPQDLSTTNAYLSIGELYRDIDYDTIFGGTSDAALQANTWLPASNSVAINQIGTTSIQWIYGDTYYQQYDCLKTYPFAENDLNSIVDIPSFICETRINMDGRYDRNKGQMSYLNARSTNFNLLNKVYSQTNNFFNYKLLDDDYYNLNNFPASLTWSLQKNSADIVDPWTQVTLASTLDLEGNKGSINKLINYNDNIFCFQDKAVSNILFNSRVQIPTSDSVPIEISNNYKVEGKRYISEDIGCKNKWSVCSTPSGLYFMDTVSNALYNINSNGLTNVSDNHGMSYWFNALDKDEWIPDWSKGNKILYDKKFNDLYIINKDTALCLSEKLGQFTSFMSYNRMDDIINIDNDVYSLRHLYNKKILSDGTQNSIVNREYLFNLFDTNSNNNIHESLVDSYITFVSNSDPTEDKIYSNINLRADLYKDKILQTNKLFDYVRIYNEYQDTGKVDLNYSIAKPSNIKEKFRTWRITVPRDSTYRLDRIRNNWTYMTLGINSLTDTDNAGKDFIIHNLDVDYFN